MGKGGKENSEREREKEVKYEKKEKGRRKKEGLKQETTGKKML